MAELGGDLVMELAGIGPGNPLAAVLAGRADILKLTAASHDAVLRPQAPGGLSHALRAALAARMARQNADPALAGHYDRLLNQSGDASPSLHHVANGGEVPPDEGRLAAVVRHADLLTRQPRQAGASEIEALRQARVDEADIVRVSELAAFLSYQVRLLAGLRLLATVEGVA